MEITSARDDIWLVLAGLVPQPGSCDECDDLAGSNEKPPIHPNCRCDYDEDE